MVSMVAVELMGLSDWGGTEVVIGYNNELLESFTTVPHCQESIQCQ